MCGIVGIISCNLKDNINLNVVTDLLHHRGPDDKGIWCDDRNIQLGHTRLSILDLTPLGHQPMSYQDGRFWITFNGEIYNYLELRQELLNLGHHFVSQTDTEVILAAYSQWGVDCLGKLRGMFAFGIWNTESKTLFLARDRVGEKPLYYWYDIDKLYFASELKALISLLPQTPELDPIAVDLYLHYQYVPEPRTPLLGVNKLPAANYLLIDIENWQIKPKCYWSLEAIKPIEGNPVELIRQELDRVIELTLRSDVPVGIALSGGIDSGAIASLAAPKYKDTLMSFSIGYPGRPAYDEREKAQKLAKSLGLPFYDIELKTEDFVDLFPDLVAATDDPIADIAAYGHYAVMKLASDKGIKVMLSGIGGDELFWGYAWVTDAVQLTQRKQQLLQNPSKSQLNWSGLELIGNHPLYQKLASSPKVPVTVRSLLKQALGNSRFTLDYPQQAIYQDLVLDFKAALGYRSKFYTERFADKIPYRNSYHPFEFNLETCKDIPVKICQLLFDTWLASNCLSLGDRVSMASSVETRIPLVDYQLIELVIGLRKVQPDHELGYKSWFKSALQGILPDEVMNRRKQGFQPPVKEWMTAILDKYLGYLESGYLINLKILDIVYLKEMINEFYKFQKHIFMLYKLLVLEIWYRKVVVSESEKLLSSSRF
jgi:asparagine synthase (glutamine-hydrolysing)